MLRRILSLILAAWAIGFGVFAVGLARPAGPVKTDAVAVLTGGSGRIVRGMTVLRQGWAPKLFVSGVDPEVKAGEFAAEFGATPAQMACCVGLGYRATDTTSNAAEVADWMSQTSARSLRVVTNDWHMRRAVMELRRVLPPGISIVEDAVPTRPTLRILFTEYHKLIARWLALKLRG